MIVDFVLWLNKMASDLFKNRACIVGKEKGNLKVGE